MIKIRNVSLALFFLCWNVKLHGQDFKSYVYAGINSSQVDGDRNGGYYKFGPRFGFGISYPIDQNHRIGFEAGYTQRGSRTEQDKNNANPIIIYRYNYLEVPILLSTQMGKLWFKAGPAFSYLINAKEDNGGGFTEMDGIKKLDISAVLALGYQLSDKWDIEGRGSYSITSVIDDDIPNAGFIRSGAYHNVLGVALKYNLN